MKGGLTVSSLVVVSDLFEHYLSRLLDSPWVFVFNACIDPNEKET